MMAGMAKRVTKKDASEAYGLVWPGKGAARREAVLGVKGRLVACAGEGVDEGKTGHVLVAGENLEALKLLKGEFGGKVGLVYIDPPYNTGKDFVYGDDFRGKAKRRNEISRKDAESEHPHPGPPPEGEGASSEFGRAHGNWLSMMYPRLMVARELMKERGVIMVSIDDNEAANLRLVMDEVFGEENFIAQVVVQSNKRGQTYRAIAKTHEYLMVYSKGGPVVFNELEKAAGPLTKRDGKGAYELWELRNRNPKFGRFNRPNLYYPIYVKTGSEDAAGHARVSLVKEEGSAEVFPVNSKGEAGCWRWGMEKLGAADLSSAHADVIARKRRDGAWNIYERARKNTSKAKSIWTESAFISEQGTTALARLGMGEAFSHPKPVEFLKRCVFMATGPEDVVLDFFAGSGTTWEAVVRQNAIDGGRRRCVLVQRSEGLSVKVPSQRAGAAFCQKAGLGEDIVEITKERLRRAGVLISREKRGVDCGFRVLWVERAE